MKTKFIFALAALLLMGSASLKAQENNNSSTTYEEGDLNHDGEVDVADITYLVNLIMNKKKTDYSKQPFTIVPINSDITVAIDAPIDAYLVIKIIFKIKFTIIPMITDIVYSFCLFVGIKYCVPKTFPIPISKRIGHIILIKIITLSYPAPKKIGTK